MVLRLIPMILLGVLVLASWDLRPLPSGQFPAPATSTPAPPFIAGPTIAPLASPAPGTPNPFYTPVPPRVTERVKRSAPMADSDILADVQQRVLSKLPQSTDAMSRRAALQTWQPQVHRYGPGQFAALSPDTATLAIDPKATLAVVVVPWGAEAGSVIARAPSRPVDYLILVYDPQYQAPSHTIWAPESGLVQAITGNHAKPTATLPPTANPTLVAGRETAVTKPTPAAGTSDSRGVGMGSVPQ